MLRPHLWERYFDEERAQAPRQAPLVSPKGSSGSPLGLYSDGLPLYHHGVLIIHSRVTPAQTPPRPGLVTRLAKWAQRSTVGSDAVLKAAANPNFAEDLRGSQAHAAVRRNLPVGPNNLAAAVEWARRRRELSGSPRKSGTPPVGH